jgi:amino acid adenylation domain-containing protein
LCRIWEEVLQVERVGVRDNFFELGGHSLLATRVVARLRKTFKVEVALLSLFERPTVAGLAEVVEEAQRTGEGLQAPPLERVARVGALPVSYAQQRMWFLNQLEPDSPLYNIPAAVRLRGNLNLPVLEQTLSEIIRRHEILRTTFALRDGHPVQLVSEPSPLQLPITDLRSLSPSEREAEATSLAIGEAQRPFDLSIGPLLRATVLRLSDDEHILLFTLHHIISDGWSTAILIREVVALYGAYSEGTASPLPDLEIQYGDYAVWQRDWLSSGVLAQQLSYWRTQLSGAPPVLELPTDRPRPPVQSYRGATHSFALSGEVRTGLQRLSQQEGTTLFMTLLAAFKVLLMKYSGQEDIVVGTPIAGRNRAEVEGLIGFFINTLVLRTGLDGNPTFRELVGRVREVTLGAYGHQEVPFEKLVEELQPERKMSRAPLFQVVFALHNIPREALELADLQLSSVESSAGAVGFDLNFVLSESANGINCSLQYSTDLFDAATVQRMMRHFELLLQSVIRNPDQRLSMLSLASTAEREQIRKWNDTRADYDYQQCLHQLFEAQVAATPDLLALSYEERHLTYAELNARANQLAHHLRSLSITPDTLVGICLERSVEMVVSLLAVLKAGGAYLPLDPQYPQERLAYMVSDAHCRVLITEESLRARLPETDAHVLCLEQAQELIARESTENLSHDVTGVTPSHLAYVIYTSGSTGRPKGVMIPHSAIANRLLWMIRHYEFTSSDRLLFKTPFSFDASVWEWCAPLLCGASVLIARPGGQRESAYLAQATREGGVTLLQLVPSMLGLVVEEAEFARCTQLRMVFSGGEGLAMSLAARCREVSAARLVNLYGPTETAIDASSWECVGVEGVESTADGARASGAMIEAGRLESIGRSISHVEMYVLDEEMRMTAVGVTGELYIGGAGLARGYGGRAELTAERFVPDAVSGRTGRRLYRTGDMGRYVEDGRLEYLGREDEQVKVRGYRIELGEIEGVLKEHGSVRECVVVARAEGTDDKRLIAYIVTDGDVSASVSQMREHLRQRLPDYMVPGSFVQLQALPLLPNGKTDRRLLARQEPVRLTREQEYIAPSTETEAGLCRIWEEVLQVERVGVRDNFFELGGHSLLATQMVSRIREMFAVEVTLRSLFESPTVADWSLVIEKNQGVQKDVTPPQIQKRARGNKNFDQLLGELNQLSESEARALLAERTRQ